jgi:hypothetical protein
MTSIYAQSLFAGDVTTPGDLVGRSQHGWQQIQQEERLIGYCGLADRLRRIKALPESQEPGNKS